jgi:hypothetical protein
MFKKIIFTGLFSAISTASFAERPAALKQDNSTYASKGTTYVGASAGWPLDKWGPVSGDAFAGYGKKFGASQSFYLGGEINAGVNHFRNSSPGVTTYSIGASVIPGFMLTPTVMAYGRLGLNTYSYKGHFSDFDKVVYGLGLHKEIDKNWGVRGEYSLSSYTAPQGQVTLGLTYKFD